MQQSARPSEDHVQSLISEYGATRDIRLRDEIVMQYRGLVESIARRFMGSGEPLDDLVQEGYIGLITASDLYNAEKGVKFSTYATHFVVGQIKHALRDRGKIIKEPAWLQELNHRMSKVVDSLSQELGRQPASSEIARIMHLPEETVRELLTTREVFKVSSLDSESEDSSFGPEIENVSDDRYTSFSLPVEDKMVLETAVDKLKIIEQKVINDFYYTGLSQTEIAKKVGISCNYVSHILRNGTKKLRRILLTDDLMESHMQMQLASRRGHAGQTTESEVVDPLTGLYTAEYIRDRVQEEISRAARARSEIAVVRLNVLGLEQVAVRSGTLRRDDLACALGELVRSKVRNCDIVGRTGEWEFSLILPYTGLQADEVCLRLIQTIRDSLDQLLASVYVDTLSIRIGCAAYPTGSSNARDLMEKAREAQVEYRMLEQALQAA